MGVPNLASSTGHFRSRQLDHRVRRHCLPEEAIASELRIHIRHQYVAKQHYVFMSSFVGGSGTI